MVIVVNIIPAKHVHISVVTTVASPTLSHTFQTWRLEKKKNFH